MAIAALDCEGPITLNDNAYEFTEILIPEGGAFFARISRYDDYLADVEKRPGYKAGDTLKLILPFLKAFGADNRKLREFSRKTLRVLPRAVETLKALNSLIPTFIISTSYRPYLEALCEVADFPIERVFCTEVDFEALRLSRAEEKELQTLARKILELPIIEIPEGARSLEDLPPESRKAVEQLEEIFWKKLPEMEAGRFLTEVNPVGGQEKARAVEIACKEIGTPPSEVLYIGDSITDVEALLLVREAGGGAVAFNANRYALRAAEFFVLSETAEPHEILARNFLARGKEGLQELSLNEHARSFIFGRLEALSPELIKRSETFRKNIRGEAIGALG